MGHEQFIFSVSMVFILELLNVIALFSNRRFEITSCTFNFHNKPFRLSRVKVIIMKNEALKLYLQNQICRIKSKQSPKKIPIKSLPIDFSKM